MGVYAGALVVVMGGTKQRAALLDDSDGGSDHDSTVNLQINKEYAKRFEHNKKREELQRRAFVLLFENHSLLTHLLPPRAMLTRRS